MEEASAFLNSDTLEITSWYPEDATVIVPANEIKTFGVSVQGGAADGVVYNFYVEDQLIGTGSEPFYNLNGSQLGEEAKTFTIKVTDGIIVDEHSFQIVKNEPPQISSSSPEERSIIVECADPLLVFNVTASDPEGGALTFEWSLNDGFLDDTIFVETSESQSRAAATIDCDNTINNTLTLKISDGVDTKEISWIYMDPVSGAIGQVGNSAIEFDPISHDFGYAKASSDTLLKTFTATNSAFTDVYINQFSGENDHFTIASTNCPLAPEKFEAGDDCSMTVSFAPTMAGSLGTNLTASYYAEGNSDQTFQSLLGVAGTGVSPLVFDGVQSISNLTHNAVTLNWNQTSTAATFVAFQVSGGLVYNSTKVNTNGTATSMDITDLTPSTAYTFRVKATDVFGNLDGNEVDVTFTTNANNPPIPAINATPSLYSGEFISTVDAYDINTNGDTDQDGDTLTYTCSYSRAAGGGFGAATGDCDTLTNEGGGTASFNTSAGVFSNWRPLHAEIGLTYTFTITAQDPYGESRTVQFSNAIVQGVPDEPTITAVSPNNATNNNNTPTVTGTATANLTVYLYSGASCATAIGFGTADGSGNFSIQVNVTDDATYTIRGRTVNAINNYSDCSSTSVTYVEDSTAPTPFTVSGTNPPSPADSLTPAIQGTTEAGASISIYSDNTCSTQVATGIAAGDGSFSVNVNATANDTATFYVVASDAAGNSTTCTDNIVSYENYSIASGIAWFRGTDTASSTEPSYQLNPSVATDLEFSSSEYDSSYFSHSRNSDSHEIEVLQNGDYFLTFNLPISFFGTQRPAMRAEIFVDGVSVKGGIGESNYIRNASSHTESSANVSVMLPNLVANQIITVKVLGTAGVVSSDIEMMVLPADAMFSLYVEHVDTSTRKVFYGSLASSATSINGGFDFGWNVDVEFDNTTFSHSTGTDPEEITLDVAGDYMIHYSVPTTSTVARTSPRSKFSVPPTEEQPSMPWTAPRPCRAIFVQLMTTIIHPSTSREFSKEWALAISSRSQHLRKPIQEMSTLPPQDTLRS